MNPLVVQTLLGEESPTEFSRWFEAVVEALAGTESGWRLLVGAAPSAELEDAPEYERRAIARGGSFAVVTVAAAGRIEAHRELARDSGDSAVLIVDLGVTILRSTVDRLVAADAPAVVPREVPLDGGIQSSDADVAPGCVLLSSGRLANIGLEEQSYEYCAEAVVHRDRRLPTVASAAADSSGASLIGDALASLTPELSAVVEPTLAATGYPLLSIVMRTQLKRPEALRDALLCVAGQTDERFELLLVVHDADAAAVEQILAEQPQRLRDRAQLLSASGGSRSRPLNVGIAAARGSHISFLDDDDLVFAHWVQSTLAGAEAFTHRIVRSAVAVQRVSAAEWGAGLIGHEAELELSVPYPARFNLADHIRVNMTPFMALAFPRRFFELAGGADEELEVCEDWDLVLRAASLLGVGDIGEVTAIYRRWTSGLDSYTVHDSSVWERDMRRVRSKLDSRPLLLPPQSASELAFMSLLRDSPSELAAVYGSTSWRVTAPMRAVSRLFDRVRARRA